MAPRWTNVINAIEVSRLKRQGWGYREIGKILAQREGRKIPYQYQAVYNALYKYRRGTRDIQPGMD